MVFITLNLIVFEEYKPIFKIYSFCSFCLNFTEAYYGLVYLICLVSVLSDAILTMLLCFVFKMDKKVLNVFNICCCCLILLFVLTPFRNIGRSHQSNASFCFPLSYLLWISFCSFFLKNTWILGGFLLVPSFGRQLCQSCEWAGSEPHVRSHIT